MPNVTPSRFQLVRHFRVSLSEETSGQNLTPTQVSQCIFTFLFMLQIEPKQCHRKKRVSKSSFLAFLFAESEMVELRVHQLHFCRVCQIIVMSLRGGLAPSSHCSILTE